VPLPSSIAQPALAAYTQAAERAAGKIDDNQPASGPSFGDLLAQSVNDAIETNKASENVSIRAASGEADLQDVVEAVNAAEISLQTVVSIRDRVISAYQEILRMPI
jgi:flagellar hook-basal body complex protein FliE